MGGNFLEEQVIAIAHQIEDLDKAASEGSANECMDGIKLLATMELRGIKERRASVVEHVRAVFEALLNRGEISQKTHDWLIEAMESNDAGIQISSF